MTISLESCPPIGTIIETTEKTGVLINDAAANQLYVDNLTSITPPFDDNDPFRIVKSAFLVTGMVHENILVSMGLQIQTWAHELHGSGLGTSCILAAVVVKGLLQITDGDESSENVTRLALVLEQLMGTEVAGRIKLEACTLGLNLLHQFLYPAFSMLVVAQHDADVVKFDVP
ncbi:hypothetical protein NC653_006805 [Populus alba x Populus x berolinensis]|uniref:Uncharacterized protein n=1 Tax=Populus alba x Populus x berolinensis TaxID=444605 RepID=A0AAD6WCL9_9ROSI|nr:hypothetical protein NC653_006805 [Populus alba x Populus x berolinensis]